MATYSTSCISQHPQLEMKNFVRAKFCCLLALMHSDYGEYTIVLLNGVTCTVSVLSISKHNINFLCTLASDNYIFPTTCALPIENPFD